MRENLIDLSFNSKQKYEVRPENDFWTNSTMKRSWKYSRNLKKNFPDGNPFIVTT